MAHDPSFFTWYELLTTDAAAAAAFYRDVVGWETKTLSTSQPFYALFSFGEVPAAGLMELPEEGRRMGAMPRWMGYVGVRDVHATADRIKHLGGAIYVPPTDTNIGRISVVADPQTATFAVVDHLRTTPQQPTDSGKLGRVGWHDLLATDLEKETTFFCDLFGWQRAESAANHETDTYVSLSAGGQTIAGALKRRPEGAPPFWLFYLNVEDLDAAAERVKAGGGKVSPKAEMPGGLIVAHCVDPQGAAFALQGKRGHDSKVGWRTEWQGFSSRGRLVTPRPRQESENEESGN